MRTLPETRWQNNGGCHLFSFLAKQWWMSPFQLPSNAWGIAIGQANAAVSTWQMADKLRITAAGYLTLVMSTGQWWLIAGAVTGVTVADAKYGIAVSALSKANAAENAAAAAYGNASRALNAADAAEKSAQDALTKCEESSK